MLLGEPAGAAMSKCHLEVIYCDDIRQEVGNKNSYMGVYAGDLFVEAFPVTLPKFCIQANVYMPAAKPAEQLRLRVMQEDRCLIDTGFLEAPPILNEKPVDVEEMLGANCAFMLAPFQIDCESFVMVVAEVNDQELVSRKLRIRKGEVA